VDGQHEKGGVSFRVISNTHAPGCSQGKETPPMLKVVDAAEAAQQESLLTLDQIAREGARKMLMSALEAEVEAYIDQHKHETDAQGHRQVVRNGKAKARKVTCGAGTLEVEAPRVNDKRVNDAGERQRFTSQILPPYMRRSPKVAEVLPVLYLRGLSTGDFRPALESLLGEDASGLSATNISRLTAVWEDEYRQFGHRSLKDRDFVYIWADGIHFNIRLEDDRLCTLVIIGVRPDGQKELVAIDDGYRESTESWKSVLRDLKKRGMRAPAVAVGDGALGFWAAVRDVWPETKEQRDWFHKMGNVLDKLPRRLQPKAKRMLREAMYADTREQADEHIDAFAEEFAPKHEKAVECLTKDRVTLLALYDYPAEHWKHLRTSNVIESPFATVRLRQRVTKGAGNRTKALTMAFKLLDMAQERWRKLNGHELLPLVRAGVQFVDGVQLERNQDREIAA
jgi:putative transposase